MSQTKDMYDTNKIKRWMEADFKQINRMEREANGRTITNKIFREKFSNKDHRHWKGQRKDRKTSGREEMTF